MVVLNFSVLKEKILSGNKSRTMRLSTSRKWIESYRNFKDGKKVKLQIYWKTNPNANGEFLFDAVLTHIEKKKLKDLTLEEWKRDGFTSIEEGLNWFKMIYKINEPMELEVFIIQFKKDKDLMFKKSLDRFL